MSKDQKKMMPGMPNKGMMKGGPAVDKTVSKPVKVARKGKARKK
jgi:hypothetical protein